MGDVLRKVWKKRGSFRDIGLEKRRKTKESIEEKKARKRESWCGEREKQKQRE